MLLLVNLLLSHSQHILDLIQRCLADDERTDSLMRLSYGLLGDLADSFPTGQLKQLLLSNWIAAELRSKHRMPPETRKTMRWAREVIFLLFLMMHNQANSSHQMVKTATQ
jgi:importin subunit beta-1